MQTEIHFKLFKNLPKWKDRRINVLDDEILSWVLESGSCLRRKEYTIIIILQDDKLVNMLLPDDSLGVPSLFKLMP